MDVAKALAGGLSLSRVGFGLGYLLQPQQARRSWIGRAGRKPGTQVIVRSQGVRDVVLGAGTLRALARDDARPWVAGQAACDLAALVAPWTARDDLPKRRARFAMLVAAVSTAVGAAAAATLGDQTGG